jgi:hypothetical protein
MPLGYKEAFGLRDNPFGPRRKVGALPPNLTADLQVKPLLLHRNPDLEKLFCDKIVSFRTACEDLKILLEADGYVADGPSDGIASYFVAIEGDRGTGKTTLACRMLQIMLQRYPEGEPANGVEEVILDSRNETVSEQREKMQKLEADGEAGESEYRCILIDDLLADAYPDVAKLYDKLRQDAAIFMVFTSWDAKMAEQIDKSLHNVERFNIAPLTPDEAVAYVTQRYQFFRAKGENGLNAEPLFPFDEDDIRTAVKVRVLSGTKNTGPVNLRLVASVLNSALKDRLKEIAREQPGFDARAVSAGELAKMKIKVAQSYKIVVRK